MCSSSPVLYTQTMSCKVILLTSLFFTTFLIHISEKGQSNRLCRYIVIVVGPDQLHSPTHVHTHARTHTLSLSLSLSHTHTHTHTLTHTHTHTLTHTHTHMHTHTHALTHIHTHAHTHAADDFQTRSELPPPG